MPEMRVEIKNEVGLHARPAAIFVQTANKFGSEITVRHGETTANAKSILSILTLGAGKGAILTLNADGEDAEQALQALADLISRDFEAPA
jgi:phosphocarrier protein HPr